MENFIAQYFKEEKTGAFILLLAGIVTISSGLYFVMKSTNQTFRGIGFPLVVFGTIQLVIGGAVYFRTDKQVAVLQLQYQNAPAVFKQEETIRMEKVNRNFKIAKIVEVVCIVLGILFMLFVTERLFWVGIGIGLLFQTAFLLGFDTMAEQRGEKYYHQIIQQNQQ